MSTGTIDVTIDFSAPDGNGGTLEFEQNGGVWTPAAIPWAGSQSFNLTQGTATTDGWLLWGIIFWGVGYDDFGGSPKKRSDVIQTPIARLFPQGTKSGTAQYGLDGLEPYGYVTDVMVGNNSGQGFVNFNVHNDNVHQDQGQVGCVCLEVIFTNAAWQQYYSSRDPEIPLKKKPA